MDDHLIPEKLYRDILRAVPSPCVDVVIPSVAGVLLVRRCNEPAKNQWWLPGGRVWKGEKLADCALRKAREEVGLHCSFQKIVHVDETIFDTGPWEIPVHTVNVCVLLARESEQDPTLDNDHSEWKWVKSIDEVPLHSYIVRCLKAARVF